MGRNDTIKEVESMASKVLKFKMWPSDEDQAGSSVCSQQQGSTKDYDAEQTGAMEAKRPRHRRGNPLWYGLICIMIATSRIDGCSQYRSLHY